MTTSNPIDLSSFEPEAILAALPGDHPKMAAALAVGRQAEHTGHLDVDELARIANEIYAQGFPAGSPFQSPAQASGIPGLDSLPDPAGGVQTAVPGANALPGLTAVPNFGSGQSLAAQPVSVPPHSAATHSPSGALGHLPVPSGQLPETGLPFADTGFAEFDVSYLLGGVEIPHQADLASLLQGEIHSPQSLVSAAPAFGIPEAGSGRAPASSGSGQHGGYYFLKDSPFQPQANIAASAHPPFDAELIRKDFPILRELVNGRPLIWFDNAATTQKPQVVIDRLAYFYQHENSNIHRAAHALAARATDAYEGARETVRRFINAPSVDNIVFARGTTEAINLVAKTWGKKHLGEGDEILITHLEHHANIVPWQQLCKETGAKLRVAPVDDSGQVLLDEYQKLLTARTKLVSFTQVSNALGTVTPAREMIQMAHAAGAKVLLDGAQSVSHMRTDVQFLDCDFFVFSGHKVFAPTGIGALYGKADLLADMPVWQGGGNMIQDVTFDKTVYHGAPAKFEAGTGNIADAVGMGAALEYVERLGIDNIARYEHELLEYATLAMQDVSGLCLIGTAKEKASVLSFSLKGYKSEEVGAALNEEGVAVRSGHHCAQPILRRFGVETTVRPSLAFYNTRGEVDTMVRVLRKLASAQRF